MWYLLLLSADEKTAHSEVKFFPSQDEARAAYKVAAAAFLRRNGAEERARAGTHEYRLDKTGKWMALPHAVAGLQRKLIRAGAIDPPFEGTINKVL